MKMIGKFCAKGPGGRDCACCGRETERLPSAERSAASVRRGRRKFRSDGSPRLGGGFLVPGQELESSSDTRTNSRISFRQGLTSSAQPCRVLLVSKRRQTENQMTDLKFHLNPDLTPRQINDVVRSKITEALEKWNIPEHQMVVQLSRRGGVRTYYFGFESPTHSTSVCSYTVGEGTMYVVRPTDYTGWHKSSARSRMRITLRDAVIFNSGIFA